MGSTMLQISDSVGSFMNGSMVAVSESGTTSMSLAWIGIQPRIDDPSNPRPSSKTPSVSSARGMVKCSHRPRKSMNLRSTITAFLSCANPITSFGFGMLRSSPSCGFFAALSGWNANRFLDGHDQDPPVRAASRPRCVEDRFQGRGDRSIGDDQLQLEQLRPAIAGAPPPDDARRFQPAGAFAADPRDGLLHRTESRGLDARLDLLHAAADGARSGPPAAARRTLSDAHPGGG